LIQGAGFGVVELHGVGSVAAQQSVLGGLDGHGFGLPPRSGYGLIVMVPAGGIDGADQAADAALLPVLAGPACCLASTSERFMAMIAEAAKDLASSDGSSANQNAVAHLKIREWNGRGGFQIGLTGSHAENSRGGLRDDGDLGALIRSKRNCVAADGLDGADNLADGGLRGGRLGLRGLWQTSSLPAGQEACSLTNN
jgi:hypothetical protein